ncbi:hypothetical protein [Helicobacter pylori]|uniref:hypothetical protein n=1 Tax=Helicobacter pylori TaxID=210 RepID=UPI001FD0F443|nr:hypothetical protein [Helicobacter pylori]UOR75650.1 hypothetical protein MPG19_02525 [Helicobacter pylori]UOS30700.1 hypothetical protein MPG53_05410 [Helicobacter pylori]
MGIKSYKEQDFSQAKEYFEKRLDAIMLKIMLEWVNFCKGMDLRINLKILPSLSLSLKSQVVGLLKRS